MNNWLAGVINNASQTSVGPDITALLAEGETVKQAFRLVRDMFVFTNRRLILVDKQGFTGRKITYRSVPYRSIVYFSIVTPGNLDLNAELELQLFGSPQPITLQLAKGVDVVTLQLVLAELIR